MKPTLATLAGSWLNLEKLTGGKLEQAVGVGLEGADEEKKRKISTEGLAMHLEANKMKMVDDGQNLRVMEW